MDVKDPGAAVPDEARGDTERPTRGARVRGGRGGRDVAGYVWDVASRAVSHVVLHRRDGRLVALSHDELDRMPGLGRSTPTGSGLVPEDPREAGLVPVEVHLEQVEPVHLLANEARAELRAAGFTDDEIDAWARDFVAQQGAGDARDLIVWIRLEEESSRPRATGARGGAAPRVPGSRPSLPEEDR